MAEVEEQLDAAALAGQPVEGGSDGEASRAPASASAEAEAEAEAAAEEMGTSDEPSLH